MSCSSDPAPAARAGIRDWAGLALLMLPVLLVSIDNTVLNFAMPSIATALDPSPAEQLWMIDVYPLVLCSLLVAMGNLGDRIGRRRILLIGSAVFAVVSAAAALSTTPAAIIAARLLMGVFGAAILPATHSLLRTTFEDRDQRRVAVSIWATGFAGGAAIGPILGGFLLEAFGWWAVFLVAVPFVLPLLLLAGAFLTESRDPDPGPFDLPSILLSALTLAPAVASITHLATAGVDPAVGAGFVLSLLAGILFVRRLLGRARPLLDLRLFADPAFSGAILVNLVSVIALIGFLFFATQHLQLIAGLTPVQAALTLLPGAAASIASGLLIVRAVRLARPGLLMAAGLLVSASAYLLTALVGVHATTATILLAYVLIGAGVGAAETLSNDLMLSAVPREKAGAASAVSETAYELGAVLGIAVLGGTLTALYRAGLKPFGDLDPGQSEAARDTLAGAMRVAGTLSDPLAAELRASAAAAFDSGVVVTAGIGAVLVIVAATLAATVLRKVTHD